jgi:uncharacterized protein YecE (DUF72 family)
MPRKVYIGTSGWNYPDWRGNFYPEEMPQRRWLRHYAKLFDTVEVNNTFYRLPRKETLRAWVDAVPSHFRFTIKMWRGITHYKKLKDAKDKLELFFDLVSVVPTRNRGVILIQIPPNQGKDVAKLESFLGDVKEITAQDRWRVAFEPRSRDWDDEDVRLVLDRARVALCVHDMEGRGPIAEPNNASFVYVRRHGPGGDTTKSYSERETAADAVRFRAWRKDRTVFVYYNNDRNAYAPRDALRVQDATPGAFRPSQAALEAAPQNRRIEVQTPRPADRGRTRSSSHV